MAAISTQAKRATSWPPGCRLAIAVVVLVGLAIRVGLIFAAPRHAFLWDHIDLMVWSDWAYAHGPAALYDLPANRLINVNLPPPFAPRATVEPYPSMNACNYPPLSGYIVWAQGALWRSFDHEVVTRTARPEIARFAGVADPAVTSRVVNTVTARAVNALLPCVADLLTAWAVLRLVRALRRAPASGWPEAAALAVCLLGPPGFLLSGFWMQLDACLVCPLVWCVYLLIARRYTWAGACFGAALMVKSQALLLTPVLVFACVAAAVRAGGTLRAALAMWRLAAAALVTVALLAAPYSLASRGHPEGGWLRWVQRSYEAPLRHQFPYTTLKAFNVWWLDFLASGQKPAALDPAGPGWCGLDKERTGQVLMIAALAVGAALCAWRWKWGDQASVALAFLVLLAAFLLLARVHERFIYYCLPFLVAAAVTFRRWRPLVVTLYVVGTFEMTWFAWLAPQDTPLEAGAQSSDAAVGSMLLAVLAVASFVYALAALLPWRWQVSEPPPASEVGRSASLFGHARGGS